jgi:acetamidase/formamidase
MATHHLDDTQPHAFWDNSYPARLRIQPGDTVVFETLEASAGQVGPDSASEVVGHLNFDLIHPLTGPVYVEGAEPGDALVVDIISIKHKGWGWNSVIPGFGLLAEDFTEPYLQIYKLGETTCEFRPDIQIPYEPFCGVMGVGPRESGRFNTIPPRENAGNIDIRHLTPGSRAFFPVLVPGALFSCGDCHSAQGDGEVNGTGIETEMTVTLTFNLQKSAHIPELRFITSPGKKLTVADEGGYYVATAHGPDLYLRWRSTLRKMKPKNSRRPLSRASIMTRA